MRSCAMRLNSVSKRARASARGSAAPTISMRESAMNVGSINVNARPRPTAPSRILGPDDVATVIEGVPDPMRKPRCALQIQHQLGRLGARYAYHDVIGAFGVGQHEVAMVGLAGKQSRAAGSAGSALAGRRNAAPVRAQR